MERSRWKEIGLEEWRDGRTYIYTVWKEENEEREEDR